jgi:glycosyltransferase involved in cell wall biosynthesis
MSSICICTYNRSKSLRRTLISLAECNVTNLGAVEVLIVDNNCTDGTVSVVDAFREWLPIRRVTESRFTDDDVTFGPG